MGTCIVVMVSIEKGSVYLLGLSILVSNGGMFVSVIVNGCQAIVEYMFELVFEWYIESSGAVWMHSYNVV